MAMKVHERNGTWRNSSQVAMHKTMTKTTGLTEAQKKKKIALVANGTIPFFCTYPICPPYYWKWTNQKILLQGERCGLKLVMKEGRKARLLLRGREPINECHGRENLT